jgi:hypothetical protein
MRKLDVVGVLALAEQEPAVLFALDARANAVGRHHLPPFMASAPARTDLTMLW